MKLAILGASVSAQSRNHVSGEITGYSEVLLLSHAKNLGISEIRRFTYSGNRLSDGGLIQSIAVRDYRPDYCIVEPNIEDESRGWAVTEDELKFIYKNIATSGARPINLFLPDHITLDP